MSSQSEKKHQPTRSRSTGALVYPDYRDNFVVWPGGAADLARFVHQPYGRMHHKVEPTKSSNSEDALTWSCFYTLDQIRGKPREQAIRNLWTLAFDNRPVPAGALDGRIWVGKKYGEDLDQTEVDASIEGNGLLVFIEAKLYSSMSLKDEAKGRTHDQIAKKLRVGVKEATQSGSQFYFLVLDIAPKEALRSMQPRASLDHARETKPGGFRSKWKTAYWFSRYKGSGHSITPLRKVFQQDMPNVDVVAVARNMGWLTWADVYKAVLRAVIESHQSSVPAP